MVQKMANPGPPPMKTVSEREAAQIDKMFTYHPTKDDQLPRYQQLRAAARDFATVIMISCPDSRERSLALTQLQLANMMANAAIACNE